MPNYEINSNVAIPENAATRSTDRLKAVLAMEVGDSVFIPNKHTAAGFAKIMRDKAGFGSVTRAYTEPDGTEGFRVWRKAPAEVLPETTVPKK